MWKGQVCSFFFSHYPLESMGSRVSEVRLLCCLRFFGSRGPGNGMVGLRFFMFSLALAFCFPLLCEQPPGEEIFLGLAFFGFSFSEEQQLTISFSLSSDPPFLFGVFLFRASARPVGIKFCLVLYQVRLVLSKHGACMLRCLPLLSMV